MNVPTRRSILGGLVGLVASVADAQFCNPTRNPNSEGCRYFKERDRQLHAMPKWYITISGETERVKVGGETAFVSYGYDRLSALGNANITVWTEKEWVQVQKNYKGLGK